MSFNLPNSEPKLLVSDDLKDLLPEDQLEQINDMFISVALVLQPREVSLTGNLVGVEFDEKIKIDIKVTIRDAFSFIGNVITDKKHSKVCQSLILMMGEDVTTIHGPYKISSTKIVEIDSSNKLCILAIDLINCAP